MATALTENKLADLILPADMSMAAKVFAFATMCVGMFIALIDIQIVSASLREIGGGLSAGRIRSASLFSVSAVAMITWPARRERRRC